MGYLEHASVRKLLQYQPAIDQCVINADPSDALASGR